MLSPTTLQFKTMKPEEYRLILRNLELHYQDFMRDSQDSQMFGADDRMQIEADFNKASRYYDSLLRSVEKGVCPGTGQNACILIA